MPSPFFSEVEVSFRGDEAPKRKKTIALSTKTCASCEMSKNCVSPKLTYVGEGEQRVLIVAGIPSKEEDEAGELGKGKEYTFLRDCLKDLGIFIKRDCWYTTAVNCRPLRGILTDHTVVQTCKNRLIQLIDELKPSKIIMLGEIPFKSLIYPRLTGRIAGTQWTMFLGDIIPDQAMGRYLCPISDPGYLLSKRKYDNGDLSKPLYEREPGTFLLWRQQLERILVQPETFYRTNYQGDCVTTTDKDQAILWLNKALEWKNVAIDFETTGLKPHRKGHRIVCASISDGMFSYSFPFFEDKEFRRAWKRLMLSEVGKIGHNIQFENLWNHTLLNYNIDNWKADTMLIAHNVHSTKPTGLKYLTYSYFGDIGYDDEADGFLKAPQREVDKYGDNAFNLIEKAPIDKLLLYNALDSLYTYKLWEILDGKCNEFQKEGNAFFLESAITLAKAQQNGFPVNLDIFEKNAHTLEKEMTELERKIEGMEEVKLWDQPDPFSFKSNQQLAHLLFDCEKIKALTFTDKGAPAVDKENLIKYNTPLVREILKWRRLEKISQYICSYRKEAVEGCIHPFFRLDSVDSFRSGCSNPNVQQNPKRDKEAKTYIRSGLRPHPGHRLIEHDHGQLEVRINACFSGDKNLMKFVTDGLDMHTLSTKETFLLEDDQMKKPYRNAIKGMFVFAEFYGSYYKQVAKDLWEFVQSDDWLPGHLSDKGVKTYDDFEKQVQEAERILWEERFPEHDQWRKDMWKFYNTHGYILTNTGFIIRGPMRRNNSFNGQVQGSAYHVLQQGMNWVQQDVEKKLEETKLLYEIHDALGASVPPHEEDLYDQIVYYNCTQRVRDRWPWITVPLVMEKERSEIDGSWDKMTSCGVLKGV